ncbi:MAG: hypothetical protein IPN43_06270 [Chitinophagaceae bacterium]|nr:hypothetical protein [Chitinophagaceae bacterium]
MSIQFHKEIFSNDNFTLKVNFTGIKDDVAIATDLRMSIYAFGSDGQPKFSESLNLEQIQSLYEHLSQVSIIRDSSKSALSEEEIDDLSGLQKVTFMEKEIENLRDLLKLEEESNIVEEVIKYENLKNMRQANLKKYFKIGLLPILSGYLESSILNVMITEELQCLAMEIS